MNSSDIDPVKVKVLLLYLGIAKHKIDQREFARQKLAVQIAQLKKISTSSIKKHVVELEKDIVDALAKEKKMKSLHLEEVEHHKELVGKIDRLERKLERYLETKEARKRRILEIENKVQQRMQSRREELSEIRESISRLESLYSSAKRNKACSVVRLNAIEKKIERLKEKLRSTALKIK